MEITEQQLLNLQDRINSKLTKYNTLFIMTIHFSADRVNDIRNKPKIKIDELENIFNQVIEKHIMAIVALNDGDTFNIKCLSSHINMPCGVKKESNPNGTITHKNILITIMRKENFHSKDDIEFTV